MIQPNLVTTKTTYLNQINLKNSLSDFGLNPKDWHLTKKNSKTYSIENKKDATFKFLGTVEERNWKELKLFSI